MEHQADAQELFDNGMWMSLNEMGERPELDPFTDDTPIECGYRTLTFVNRASKGTLCLQAKRQL